jgi:hypothetical protein
MRKLVLISLLIAFLFSCNKETPKKDGCDIQRTLNENAAKLTITNGLWGTISSIEGDCMPVVPPATSNCTHCPVQRTIRIYPYTTTSQANGTAPLYDSFTTSVVAEVPTDAQGFFQVDIPAGHYSIAIVENGKLYVGTMDGQGGLCPVVFNGGTAMNVNIAMTYKAAF